MREELEKQLFDDFPLLYDRKADYRSSCMGFGFECGDGWYGLIRELSEKLYPLVVDMHSRPQEYDMYPTASQVKEKFGELRFYMNCASDEMYDLINHYEDVSGKVCEVCGSNGEIDYSEKWLSSRCDQHRKV
jgi:hypothetical protein